MKKFILSFLVLLSLGFAAQAGSESYSGKEVKQVVPPPCPEWYGDTEWNVSLWGAYVFTSEDWASDDYLETDHAWGGGMDVKYFFARYFGIGVEGWAVDAERDVLDVSGIGFPTVTTTHDSRIIGAVLGTITFRYPFHCSRFAPYIFGGAGAIFGGGERDEVVIGGTIAPTFSTIHHDGNTEFLGQVGGGFEVRFTRHIGWLNDFSWNFVGRNHSDFGMARSGINFAF